MWHTHIIVRPVQASFSNVPACSIVSKDVGGENGYLVCLIRALGSKQLLLVGNYLAKVSFYNNKCLLLLYPEKCFSLEL